MIYCKFTRLNLYVTSFVIGVVGIFFVLPCIESYTKVDLRTVSFDVPPQEVSAGRVITSATEAAGPVF